VAAATQTNRQLNRWTVLLRKAPFAAAT